MYRLLNHRGCVENGGALVMTVRMDIKPKWVEWAVGKADEMGLLKNSITDGEGNAAGFLGELLIIKHYGGSLHHSYDHDVIVDGMTGDVKTKRCTSEPRPEYECTVAATSLHQSPDEYFFVRVLEDLSIGWLCGFIAHDTFFAHAKFGKKGDPDPAKPSWPFKADCYNMSISEVQRLGGL